jgi:hypothetical protein
MGSLIVGCLSLALQLWHPLCLLINFACVFWAVKCSLGRVGGDLGKDKVWLSGVPLILFYLLIDWIILII